MDASTDIPGFENHNLPPERVDEAHAIYRAIGRNIVLLQQMEQMLKALAVHANVSGPAAELLAEQKRRTKRWKKGRLGALVEDHAKRVFGEPNADRVDEGHFAIAFSLSSPDAERKELESRVRRIVKQRNQLVHGLPFPWVPGNPTHFVELRDWLDQLSRDVVAEWQSLKHQMKVFSQMMELLKAQLESDFFELEEEDQRVWLADRGIELEPPPH